MKSLFCERMADERVPEPALLREDGFPFKIRGFA